MTAPKPPTAPDPTQPHPVAGHDRVGFLKPMITRSNIEVGDYTYYDDPAGPERFETENVLYHYDHSGDRLVIGRYCALATGTTFIMNGANHRSDGVSTFPFPIFGAPWADHFGLLMEVPSKGDTVVGSDVWFGYRCMILPGVKIGHGAVIAAGAVVSGDVAPFTIVAGNPARPVRSRFSQADIDRLLAIAWWDWPPELVTRHLHTIMAGDVDGLARALAEG